jgi:hypothetical protein
MPNTHPVIPFRSICQMSSKRLGELLALSNLSKLAYDLIMDELDNRKYDEPHEDSPCLDYSLQQHEAMGGR